MTGDVHRKRLLAVALVVCAVAVLYVSKVPLLMPGRVAAYVVLSLLPGVGIHLLLERRASLVDVTLSSVVASPLLTGATATFLMLVGLSASNAATVLVCLWAIVGIAAIWYSRKTSVPARVQRRPRIVLLVSTIALFCVVAGYLPLTHQLWRQWADAWFHGAVVAQIDRFGIPPEDPYFAGMQLQYMWFYHVLIIGLAKAAAIDPFMVMPLVNIQAMIGFALGAFLLGRLRKGFAFGYFAVLTAVLALNAGIWMFLPFKLIRSLIGDTRGWAEVVRNFTLIPFDKDTASEWVRVYSNQTFLLNKFIVSTAFSLGLGYMSVLWYAVIRHLDRPDRGALFFVFIAVAGMLLFHPLVGVVMLEIGAGVLILLWLFRRHLVDYSGRPLVHLALTVALALVVTAPYLYSVTHLKEGEQLFPLSLSFRKSLGILISCALALILGCFQFRRLVAERTMRSYTFVFGTAWAFLLCNMLQLPQSNTYDKLPFFVFYPLAILAGWTFADRISRRQASHRYRRRVVLVAVLLLLPINLLMTIAYFRTTPRAQITPQEQVVANWVSKKTPRDALFLDSGDRVFLLVAGPRRYYWGRESYAVQWGYPKAEMATRKRLRDNLFSSETITIASFRVMGRLRDPLYVIARDDEPTTGGSARFMDQPNFFHEVFRRGVIAVFEVDRSACARLAGDARQKGAE